MKLPFYLTIELVEEDNSVKVFINSRIHVNKRSKLSMSFSYDYTDEEIIKYCSSIIREMYGLALETSLH